MPRLLCFVFSLLAVVFCIAWLPVRDGQVCTETDYTNPDGPAEDMISIAKGDQVSRGFATRSSTHSLEVQQSNRVPDLLQLHV